jgi:AraC-like DNA-binding protein
VGSSDALTPSDPLAGFLSTFNILDAKLVLAPAGFSAPIHCGLEGSVEFGAVLEGSYNLRLRGRCRPVRLLAGDCFVLTSALPERGLAGAERSDAAPEGSIVVARLTLDQAGMKWFQEVLPELIHVPASRRQAKALSTIIRLLGTECETDTPGKDAITTRLADVLLIQAVRAYLEDRPEATNWLAAITDPQIGRAIRSYHADVAADWTVASLARAAGMSRSSFAARFRLKVGMPPLEYVARWRMYRVRRDLLETALPFATIAYRNGYSSRSYCSLAFKQAFGCSPTAFRAGRDPTRDSAGRFRSQRDSAGS